MTKLCCGTVNALHWHLWARTSLVAQVLSAVLRPGLFEGRADTVVHKRLSGTLSRPMLMKRLEECDRKHKRATKGDAEGEDDKDSGGDEFFDEFDYKEEAANVATRGQLRKSVAKADARTEGVLIYTLLLSLGDVDAKWVLTDEEKKQGKCAWLSNEMLTVEIQWQGALHRVHFPMPALGKGWSNASRGKVKEKCFPRSEESLKLFVEEADEAVREAKHQQRLDRMGVGVMFSAERMKLMRDISFMVAVLINLILLMLYRVDVDNHWGVTLRPYFNMTASSLIDYGDPVHDEDPSMRYVLWLPVSR